MKHSVCESCLSVCLCVLSRQKLTTGELHIRSQCNLAKYVYGETYKCLDFGDI